MIGSERFTLRVPKKPQAEQSALGRLGAARPRKASPGAAGRGLAPQGGRGLGPSSLPGVFAAMDKATSRTDAAA